MKRIKSIDIIRGISMWIMVAGHIGIWWLREEDNWLRDWLYAFIEPIGSTGFIFVSGISTALAFNNNRLKMQNVNEFSMNMARNVYLIRAEAVDKLKAKKSYRFLFFYSYYSFTIYLAHYALYFVLLNKLNIYTLWAPMILTTILLGLLLRFVYKKLGPKASLKSGIGFLSYILAKKIEKMNRT